MRSAWTGGCAAKPAPREQAPTAAPAPVEHRPLSADRERSRRSEEESMLAEAGRDDTPARRDPEEAALELLQNELGARRIEKLAFATSQIVFYGVRQALRPLRLGFLERAAVFGPRLVLQR